MAPLPYENLIFEVPSLEKINKKRSKIDALHDPQRRRQKSTTLDPFWGPTWCFLGARTAPKTAPKSVKNTYRLHRASGRGKGSPAPPPDGSRRERDVSRGHTIKPTIFSKNGSGTTIFFSFYVFGLSGVVKGGEPLQRGGCPPPLRTASFFQTSCDERLWL